MSSTADNLNPNAPTSQAASPTGQTTPARESMSLKRAREGSIDPGASETPSITPIAAKKNRLEEDTAADTDDETTAANSTAPAIEGQTVGEVRKKVEEMTWKEGDPKPKPQPENQSIAEEDEGDKSVDGNDESKGSNDGGDSSDWVKVDKPEAPASDEGGADSDTPSLKRKAGDDVEAASPGSDEKKRKSPAPAETASSSSTTPAAAAVEPPKKPMATFGAFSSKASPFASARSASPFASAGGSASPFASVSASPSPFGSAAAKATTAGPSALDGAAAAPATAAPALAKPASSASGFSASGFGSYSSAFSPFAKKPEATEETAKTEAASSTSFGDILKEKGNDDDTEEKKVTLDRQDVHTGEEEEETVYQTRVKLYAMEGNAWKERGVGALKLNKKRADGTHARLVMRAEGVLRVILNASLYVGMTCLEDGKHVRTTVFEGKERRHITFRTASPKVAAELSAIISEHTPLESRKTASPEAPRAADSEV